MSIAFDDDKNWRVPREEEEQIVKKWADNTAKILKTEFILTLVVLFMPYIGLIILWLYSETNGSHQGIGALIATTILFIPIIIWRSRVAFLFPRLIAQRRYEVQDGIVTSMKVHYKSHSPHTFITLVSGNGITKQVEIERKNLPNDPVGKEGIIVKVEPHGSGYLDETYLVMVSD